MESHKKFTDGKSELNTTNVIKTNIRLKQSFYEVCTLQEYRHKYFCMTCGVMFNRYHSIPI